MTLKFSDKPTVRKLVQTELKLDSLSLLTRITECCFVVGLGFRCILLICKDISLIRLGKTSFKFSAPKIWETVTPGLKCLPYHKFKKEWKSSLLTNQI